MEKSFRIGGTGQSAVAARTAASKTTANRWRHIDIFEAIFYQVVGRGESKMMSVTDDVR
jgi:hypothetical protein